MSAFYSDLTFTNFPNNIQNFVTMLNMVATDGELIKNYQLAMQQGNLALAQTYYNQITNANQKFVDATKLNTMMDTIVAVQRFYQTDVQPYVTTKQAEWQGVIDHFRYRGVYSPTTQYQQNNFVLYNFNGINLVYICTATPSGIGVTPTDTNYWRQLSIQGQKGDSGQGLAFLYTWNSEVAYSLQDLVTYNNALWGCVQPNTNQPPYSGSAYWQQVGLIGQAVYPLQPNAPTGQSNGELWFRTLGEVT